MKKSLLFLVVFALLWGGVATVQAAIYSGECGAEGANVTWKLDTETGLLEISGTGAMKDYSHYSYYSRAPWYNYRSYITSVTIGEGVTSIGYCAFYDCKNLTSITIPNSVTAIGDESFSGCTGLTTVTIPESVQTIGKSAFENCSVLKKVYISDLAAWCRIDFKNYVSNPLYYAHNLYLDNTLVTDLKIPDGVTSIGNGAFRNCSGLTSVTIPESVTTIGDESFSGCTGLAEVTIGNGVTSIGNWAFRGCTGLEKFDGKFASSDHRCLIVNDTLRLVAPSGLTEYSIPNEVKVIGGSAFSGCSGLTSVTIPEGVTSIGYRAFYDCKNLTSITIPNSVTSIGNDAFSGCSGLTEVTIGESVTSIGSDAFSGCRGLEKFDGKFASSDHRCLIVNDTLRFFAPSGLTEYSIPNEVKVIDDYAFLICTGLTEVTIPNSVTSIGNKAFWACSGLNKVYISDLAAWCRIDFKNYDSNPLYYAHNLYLDNILVTDLKIPDDITEIYPYAFSGCTSLASVTIPEGVTSIGSLAFYDCTSLVSVTIPNSVTSIDNVFNNCTGLKKVYISDLAAWCRIDFKSVSSNPLYHAHNLYLDNTPVTDLKIPDGVTEIYPYAFSGCTSLASVTIPNSVTSIGNDAFSGCSGLRSVTIGSRVATIGKSAFYGCTNLRTITAQRATPPSIIGYSGSWSAFDNNTYKYATVNCPKGTMHIYKNADGWKNFTYPTAEKVLNPKFINGTAGQTTYSFTFSYTRDIDYPVSKFYILTEGKKYLIDTDTTKSSIPVTLTDLEPQTEYKNIEFVIETVYGEKAAVSVTFTTDTVHLTTQPAKTTNAKATLEAAVECDAETGYGFEWRRYGAPDNLPPTRVEAYNIDGKISGTLRKLTPDTYYEYRPYYCTAKGKYYYGAWLSFGTFDYGVEWDPTVSTRTGEVRGNTTTLSGYIVEGSDEIISQGFEYWAESPAGSTTAGEHKRVEGSGSLMNVTLTGLDYNTTYYYRAYATTAKKTTYGTTESFTTGENPNPSGIEETAAEDGFAVRLSGNPVRNGEIGVQVVGADGATWYRVISLHGAQIAQGVLSGTDEWQPVKIPAASTGHYLLQIIGSKGTKTLRIVVE